MFEERETLEDKIRYVKPWLAILLIAWGIFIMLIFFR